MIGLVLATEGACAGHLCDNCRICQRGRCCRNDNPHYVLPQMGDWDGPIFGELGKLNDDGNKVECHCCGKWFGRLGIHVWKSHDMTPEEYRAIFGLRYSQSLDGPGTQAKHRTPELLAHLENVRPSVSWLASLTPEQRSAATGRTWRLQSKIDPTTQEAIRKRHQKIGETHRRLHAEGKLKVNESFIAGAKEASAKGRAALAQLFAAPEYRAAWAERISEVKGGKVPVTCSICGAVFKVSPHVARGQKGRAPRQTCAKPECLSELRRRNSTRADVMRRPEVREKIVAAKRGVYPPHLRAANEARKAPAV